MKALSVGSFLFFASLSFFAQAKAAFEVIPLDEGVKNQGLAETIKSRLAKQRDVHPKTHGCIDGVRVKVLEQELPSGLRVGLFATPGKEYDAIVRTSNGSGDPGVDDNTGGGQGFALKILLEEAEQKRVHKIAGEKFFEKAKYYRTQDILGINRVPEFFVENVDDYFAFFGAQGAVAAATKKAAAEGKKPEEIAKIGAATFDKIFIHPEGQEHRERQAAVAARIRAIKTLDPLVEEYFSMVPSRLSAQAVKYRMRPCDFRDPNDVKFPPHIDPKKDRNYLRSMAKHRLSSGEICYKLAIQVHKDGMPPIEQASSSWSTELSDYVDVATLTIPRKVPGHELMDEELCETLSFTPWHSIPEHLPVGAVQRTRETVYKVVSNQRNENAGRKEVPKSE